jgi:hypothetical protein
LETVLSSGSVQRAYKEDCWGNRVSSVRESVKKRVSCKGADDSPLLEAVTREWLVKTQQTE